MTKHHPIADTPAHGIAQHKALLNKTALKHPSPHDTIAAHTARGADEPMTKHQAIADTPAHGIAQHKALLNKTALKHPSRDDTFLAHTATGS